MQRSHVTSVPKGVVILGGAHGSLALARSLGKSGVPVCYISNDSSLPAWSRHVSQTVAWAGPEAPDAVDELLTIASQHDLAGMVLVPASDQDVKLVSQNAVRLSSVFKVILPEWERLRWLCDKPYLYRRAAELGIAYPQTYEIPTLQQMAGIDPAFPVVLKPSMGGGNSALAKAKVMQIDDASSFRHVFSEAAKELGAANIVVQELIPGGGESQFSYAAFWFQNKPVAEFTAQRSRQYPVDFGFTSTCVEVAEVPGIIDAARKLLASVDFSGLVEIEFKCDPRNGVLNVLDVNPRPWSWFALSAAAGVDLGKILWVVMNGGKPPVQPPRPATVWIYLSRDVAAAVILLMRGKLSVRSYLRSLCKVRAWAAFSWRDIKPGLIDLPLTLYRVVTRRIFNLSK